LKTIAAVTAFMLSALSFDASAGVVKYRFTAQVTAIVEFANGVGSARDSSVLTGKTISIGESAFGYLQFDTATPVYSDYQRDPANTGDYSLYVGSGISSISFEAGGHEFHSDPTEWIPMFDVANGASEYGGADAFTSVTFAPWSQSKSEWLDFVLMDFGASALNDSNIPAQLTLAQFPYARFNYSWHEVDDQRQMTAMGTITSLTLVEDVQAVPEPASWLLVLAGMAAIGGIARRRAAP
jgi:hypothetical protein